VANRSMSASRIKNLFQSAPGAAPGGGSAAAPSERTLVLHARTTNTKRVKEKIARLFCSALQTFASFKNKPSPKKAHQVLQKHFGDHTARQALFFLWWPPRRQPPIFLWNHTLGLLDFRASVKPERITRKTCHPGGPAQQAMETGKPRVIQNIFQRQNPRGINPSAELPSTWM